MAKYVVDGLLVVKAAGYLPSHDRGAFAEVRRREELRRHHARKRAYRQGKRPPEQAFRYAKEIDERRRAGVIEYPPKPGRAVGAQNTSPSFLSGFLEPFRRLQRARNVPTAPVQVRVKEQKEKEKTR